MNDRHTGIFIRNNSSSSAKIANNIFVGRGKVLLGSGEATGNLLVESTLTDPSGNLTAKSARFVDRAAYDYRLTDGSPAVDAAIDPGEARFLLRPVSEYVHPAKDKPRESTGSPDIGAFELGGR